MAAYADYAYYTGVYKGSAIAESEFDRLILRASSYIDRLTSGRAASYSPADPVKMAACAVAEAWQVNESGGDLQSQSVGSWSRSYATKVKSADMRLYDAAAMYLDGTGLIRRWL
jgi:hypothetical protein